jgi:CRISPR-associated endonuclease/helicase Cas3
MDSYSFTIDGVGLRTNEDALSSYPDEVQPYDHQIAMQDVIANDDDFTAVNTAPTGGGKTWSWVVPCVENNNHVLAAFPTNALAEDQKQSIQEYKRKHTEDGELGVLTLTGASIERQMRAEGTSLSKGDWMEQQIREGKLRYDSLIVLTNPDVFTLLRRGMYQNTYAKYHSGFFDAIVFDEFHVADTKGWNSLLFLLDELYADTQRGEEYATTSKFIFLSATPEEKVYDRLENGMNVPTFHDLTDEASDGRQPWSKVSDKDNWRAVMPPVDVEIRQGETFDTASQLLEDETIDDVLEFCTGGRTVVMLDGIREVDGVYETFSDRLPNKTVHRIDGQNGANIDTKLSEFDVLVSNSAVEVGIDFDVDRILMSGYQQKAFLQRIGRLRNKEEQLKAVCYIPRRAVDGFKSEIGKVYNVLPADRPVPRWKLEEIVKELFPEPRDPELFAPMYSAIEGFMHIEQKTDRMTADATRAYLPEARRRLASHFFDPYEWELTEDRLTNLIKKAQSPLNQDNDAFADTLSTYRNNGLSTLVYDTTSDEVYSYSLFYFLRWGDIEFLTESEFENHVPDRHRRDIQQKKRYSTGFCVYNGQRETADDEDNQRTARLGATQVLRELTELDPEQREPVTLTGLQIRVEDPVQGLAKLNRALADRPFLCYPIEGSSYRIQQEFNLDDFFFLYDLTDLRGNYSLAVGLNSLYLHCHVVNRCETKDEPEEYPLA